MTHNDLPPMTARTFIDIATLTCRHCARVMEECEAFADAVAATRERRAPRFWIAGRTPDTPSCNRYLTKAALGTPYHGDLKGPARKEPCVGCAARKGSEASRTLHTQRDFQACVRTGHRFDCHHGTRAGKPCSGWARARLAYLEGKSNG